jgi:hypothetical protein
MMMLPANPPLVSNSKMDNVFSTETSFGCATDRESSNILIQLFHYETNIYKNCNFSRLMYQTNIK